MWRWIRRRLGIRPKIRVIGNVRWANVPPARESSTSSESVFGEAAGYLSGPAKRSSPPA